MAMDSSRAVMNRLLMNIFQENNSSDANNKKHVDAEV
jgi:hypothetical protein